MDTIASILIYGLSFLFSFILCCLFESSITVPDGNGRHHFVRNLLAAIVIALPVSVLFALRGLDVGVDTKVYHTYFQLAASYHNLSDYLKVFGDSPLFWVLVYGGSHLFHNETIYLILCQLIPSVISIFIGVRLSSEVPVWQVYLIYLFWFYNDSMNGMRQYMTVPIMLLGYLLLKDKKIIGGIIALAIGVGLHQGALVIVPIFIILLFENFDRISIKQILITIASIIVLANAGIIFEKLYQTGILPYRYHMYLSAFFTHDTTQYNAYLISHVGYWMYFEILVRLVLIIFIYLLIIRGEHDSRYREYLFMIFVGTLIYATGVFTYHTIYFQRISVYFDAFLLYLLPLLDKRYKVYIGQGYESKSIPIFSCVFSAIYWLMHVGVFNSGATIPFHLI